VDHYLIPTLILRLSEWSYTYYLALRLRDEDNDDFISLAIGESASTVRYEFDDNVATRVKFEET